MTKNITIATIIIVVFVVASIYIYRHFFEFNNTQVKKYITDDTAQYGNNANTAYDIVHDAAMHILNNRSLIKQVRSYAAQTGMPKERVLINSAIGQAQAYRYI